jgi:putative ABC transport system permease protein
VQYVSKSTAVPASQYVDTSTLKFSFGGHPYPLCSVRVSADYFKTLDISLVQGRLFSDQHPEDNNNTAIINEAGSRMLGITNPVGSLIRFPYCDSIPYQIVGVVKDFNVQGFENAVHPTVYSISNAHCGYQSGGAILVKLNTHQIQGTMSEINAAWKKIEPEFPIRYSFIDQDFEHLLKNYLLLQNIILIFTVISIGISMLGLLALTAYMAERRTREIGIRKVLGASVFNLADLLTRDFVWLLVVAIGIASPLAWYILNKWLENFAYRITISWWVFAGAAVASIGLALVLVGFHALRTARSNPVQALRNE